MAGMETVAPRMSVGRRAMDTGDILSPWKALRSAVEAFCFIAIDLPDVGRGIGPPPQESMVVTLIAASRNLSFGASFGKTTANLSPRQPGATLAA